MSDGKFINTYIDVIVGTLHEHLNTVLQLKTQLKVANDLLQEKDQFIGHLQNQVLELEKNSVESRTNDEELRKSRDIIHALETKVSHMDTLTKQISSMKNEILARDTEIESLNERMSQLQQSKPKSKKKDLTGINTNKISEQKNTNDDF